MPLFLFTSCYDVMFSSTLIFCLYNRTRRSETSTKSVFSAEENFSPREFSVSNTAIPANLWEFGYVSLGLI